MVVQLAQLKGLMESQTTAARRGQEESSQSLLQLSTQEVFSLLDLNQDGLLQKQEVSEERTDVRLLSTLLVTVSDGCQCFFWLWPRL